MQPQHDALALGHTESFSSRSLCMILMELFLFTARSRHASFYYTVISTDSHDRTQNTAGIIGEMNVTSLHACGCRGDHSLVLLCIIYVRTMGGPEPRGTESPRGAKTRRGEVSCSAPV